MAPTEPWASGTLQFGGGWRRGEAEQNSVVMAAVNWAARTFTEPELLVERRQGDTWQRNDEHPAQSLVRSPHARLGEPSKVSGRALWQSVLNHLILDGNAYLHKVRSANGEVIGLDWLPSTAVEPVAESGTTNRLAGYRVAQGGRQIWLDGGGVADDQGQDTLARGRSSLWLGQPGRSSVYELFGGRQAWRVGLRLTVAGPGGQVTLDWPEFRRCETTPQWVREQPMRGTWVWPLGPAFRAGHWDWFLTSWLRPPLVKPQPFVGTALDYLAARRLVWQGIDPDVDADAVFATWFDLFEGNDAAEAEKNSYTFPWMHQASLAMRTAIVNSAAELPPLAHFPLRARDTAGEPVGEWSNELWVGGDEPRWWLSNQPLELRSPEGAEWLTEASPGVPGWKLKWHRHPLDHTESEFDVRSSGENIARVKPWRGAYAIIDHAANPGTALAADVGPDQRAVVALVVEDSLHVRQFDHHGRLLSDSDVGEQATTAAVRYDRRTPEAGIALWWAAAGHLKTATFTEGVWSPFVSIMATEASHPAAWISPDGMTWLYWIVGESVGDVYGQLTDRAGNLLFGPALVSGIGPVEVTGLATGESFESDGRRRISLWVRQEGELREYRSFDGRAFA